MERALQIQKDLSSKIFGQDMAIESVVDSVKNQVIRPQNSPKSVFFFLGPAATGKTYMAKSMVENFDGYEYLELNMQEFQDYDSGMKIFGTEPGWRTAAPGLLTSFVNKNPKTLILFDEFEKAHSNIQKKLLSLFSEGYLNDANGWIESEVYDRGNKSHKNKVPHTKVDFTQTIIVITSNLGKSIYNNQQFLRMLDKDTEKAETMIIQTLQKEKKSESGYQVTAILPEMLSRLSQAKIVIFKALMFEHLKKVAHKEFSKQLLMLLKKYKITFDNQEDWSHFITCSLLSFAPYMDTRRIKAKIYENFANKLTDFLLENKKTWKDVSTIDLNISGVMKQFIEKNITPKVKNRTLLKELLRKNLTFEYNYNIKLKEKTLLLTISHGSFQKVTKVSDTIGVGAINFNVPTTSFKHIAGHNEVKNRLKEIALYLKFPGKLKKQKAKIPKGMLLYGAPGTGKTMLAKAFANFANLPFIQTTANDLIDYTNNNMSTMKNVFDRAREYAPSIIFIDEVDSFGSRDNNGNKVVINELLTQINGFSDNPDETVFIIAATNRKSDIDPAIIRAGRIELHVEVPTLDKEGRRYFIEQMLKKPSKDDINLEKLVDYTVGMTGAQLEKVSNESSLCVLRQRGEVITEEIIIEQINIEKYGKKTNFNQSKKDILKTAYHEAGHAVISKILEPDMIIEQVSIVQREGSLGFVSYHHDNYIQNPDKQNLENRICISYAGRLSEVKKFGDEGINVGSSNDIKYASRLGFLMFAEYGMGEEVGYIDIDAAVQNQTPTNSYLSIKVEKELETYLKEQTLKTEQLIEDNWDKIENTVRLLLEKETLHDEDLMEVVNS